MIRLCGRTLKSLDVSATNIKGEQLDLPSNLPLEHLCLSMCEELSDEGLCKFLAVCGQQKLKHLDLTGTNITFENIKSCEALRLEYLNLSWCKHITTQGLGVMLWQTGHSLKSLDLSSTNISGEKLSECSGFLGNLTDLLLSNCKTLTDNGLLSVLTKVGPKLQTLDLSDTDISGTSLIRLNKEFFHLDHLNLSNCRFLRDKGLKNMLTLFGHQLKHLNATETSITGENIRTGHRTLGNLRTLHLSICKKLTDPGLREILEMCSINLQVLDMGSTNIEGKSSYFEKKNKKTFEMFLSS